MNYKIVYDGKPLKPFEIPKAVHGRYSASQLLRIALLALKGVNLYESEARKCEFEDGRKDWMVSAFKYFRLKTLNGELRAENAKLKDQIRALTGLNKND
jgi:hypothetical protein